ncbi:MAG: hypothetical protein ACYC9M_06175 [Desulfobulbaceae bacterium]
MIKAYRVHKGTRDLKAFREIQARKGHKATLDFRGHKETKDLKASRVIPDLKGHREILGFKAL